MRIVSAAPFALLCLAAALPACAPLDDSSAEASADLGVTSAALEEGDDLEDAGSELPDEADAGELASHDVTDEASGVGDADELGVVVKPGGAKDAVIGKDGASARRATCIFPKFTRYPGITTLGRFRYGQVDVHFDLCSDQHPGDWKVSINAWHNGTASAQGYDFINDEVHATGGGDYYRFYKATFKLQDCMPFYGWPCKVRGTFAMEFYAYVVEGKPHVQLLSASAPSYWTLYTTH